ncbi:hypothetical protein K4F52_000315 [Lecanicillium sp. MT-2017a]|nr:hypothetical protein K4F52_000315 [Lecanicillium sp. MT-2017a]
MADRPSSEAAVSNKAHNPEQREDDSHPSKPTASLSPNDATTSGDSALGSEQSDLEPGTDGGSETDSALGDDNDSITTSLRSSIYNYREENGRTYHSYLESINYVLPNDGTEQDRLSETISSLRLRFCWPYDGLTKTADLQHHLFTLTLGGKIYKAPIETHPNLQRILDAGTGTGVWAMDIGDEFPQAEVIGVDLSPIQPTFVPPNVRFIIDNIEDEWEYPDPLDYVFGRMLVGSVGDWPKFIAQSFDNLRSGGWLELQDMVLHPQCIDDSLKEDSFIKKWADAMLDSTARINRFADSGIHYKQQMIDAGFINVTEVVYKWPTNTWPKNDPYRDIGMLTLNRVYSQQQS